MAGTQGGFVWYELLTTDPAAAGAFYVDVFGWTIGQSWGAVVGEHDGEDGYKLFLCAGVEMGGMMALPAAAVEGGMRPGWYGYIEVGDVDAATEAVVRGGGAICMPPTDLPGVGRLAMVLDPQGAAFYVIAGGSDHPSAGFDPTADGRCAWNELATDDLAAALDFYAARFGWTKGDVMRMGAMGDYRFIDHGGATIGAMMGRPPGGPPPAWTFYFRVPDIDAAVARVAAGGGTIRRGPDEVPGGDHVVLATDPQGVAFALVGRRGR